MAIHLESFAKDVINALGGYQRSPVSEFELANFVDNQGDPWGPWDWDDTYLRHWGITSPPPGWTWEELSEVPFGTHVFLADESTNKFYDVEAPQGVSSPFELPFFQRYLADHRNKGKPGDNEWERARQRSLERQE